MALIRTAACYFERTLLRSLPCASKLPDNNAKSQTQTFTRCIKNFAHAKSPRPPYMVIGYGIFLSVGMCLTLFDWTRCNINWEKYGATKVEAASLLAESAKKKSKKIEENECDQEVEEIKNETKGKKKERPGFRDRKVI